MKMSRSEAAVVAARASAQVRRARVNERYAARLRADGWTCTPPPDQQDTDSAPNPGRGPHYQECPLCPDMAAMSQASLHNHIQLDHPDTGSSSVGP